MGARTIEHLKSQGTDIARRSSVAKPDGASPIHAGMVSKSRGASLGGPTQGNPPDASSPLVTDPSRQGKSFSVPPIAHGMTSDPQRGRYDPAFAEAMMNEASRAPDDYAKDLHATLPRGVTEN